MNHESRNLRRWLCLLVAALALLGTVRCSENTAPERPPLTPSNLTATATAGSATQIDLTWQDNATNEDGFRVERAPGGTTSFAEIATVGSNATSYQSTGLTPGTSYSYRVRAYNAVGASAYSNTVTTTTLSAPAAPSNLTATPTAGSGTQIDLAWHDNATNEDGFRIERCNGAGCIAFTEIATLGPNVTSYPSPGLTPGTSYSYRVRAYNAVGPSDYSNTATATTLSVPTKLGFTVQPSTTVAGQTITPAVKVAIQDAGGNTVTTATSVVTLAIGTNPASGTLSGTTSVAAVNGGATLSNLSLNHA